MAKCYEGINVTAISFVTDILVRLSFGIFTGETNREKGLWLESGVKNLDLA